MWGLLYLFMIIHTFGTWLERDMYEDACTGYRYSLDTVTSYKSMWKKLHRVRIFQNAYAGCIIVWLRTYMGCIIDRAHTYTCFITTSHVHVVFCWYMFNSGTYWLQGSCTGWMHVSGTDWYNCIVVYLTMIVWQWFHHSTYILGWLDEARTGGCSHLSVVAKEHRGL